MLNNFTFYYCFEMFGSLWTIIREYTYKGFSGFNKVYSNLLNTDMCSVMCTISDRLFSALLLPINLAGLHSPIMD
jgi:hypothetical protein